MTIAIVTLVGGAVDYGRWLNARNQTQTAIDSALLAAGRTAQTSNGNETASLAAANTYYSQHEVAARHRRHRDVRVDRMP